MFAALRHRNYRLFWIGTVVSNSGDWMDQIALNWLVVSLTGSPFHLALLNLCRALPILAFTLVGGAVADRAERRRMLMATQGCAMLLAVLLACLAFAGSPPVWTVMLLAAARGTVVAFNLPARHSLVPELVPAGDLPNAVALNSMTVNMTKVAGPALAGIVIAILGLPACFALNALSFTVVLATLARMQLPGTGLRAVRQESMARSIREGLAFTAGDKRLLLLLAAALVPTFFGQPYMALLTLFAHDVYRIGPDGLGLLSACAGAGSAAGGALLAARPVWASSQRAMLAFMVLLGLFLLLFAVAQDLAAAVPLLFCAGAMLVACNASVMTLLQISVPGHMRGRVLSVMLLNRGLSQVGVAALAALAGLAGVQAAVACAGLAIAMLGGAFLAASPLGRRQQAAG